MKKITIFAWLIAGIVTVSSIFQAIPLITNLPAETSIPATLTALVVLFLLRPVFSILAALIVSRQPRNAVGWLMFLPGTAFIFNAEPYIRSFTTAPQPPPLQLLLSLWYSTTAWLLLIFPIFFIMVLYPTGRPPSPRWRWLIAAGLGMCIFFLFLVTFGRTYSAIDFGRDWEITNPIGFIELGENQGLFFVIWGIGLISIAILSVVSLVVRYRQAAAVERVQIKWLLYACAVFAVFYGAAYPINTIEEWSAYRIAANSLWQISMMGIPISITIAILRYRVWDIDLVIRRTLAYSVLTGLLGLVYLGLVTLLQSIFAGASGQQSPVALVVSTLAIAALFNPLRKRVQEWIDRRFFRKKYDAEKTLEDFSASLRQEVDLSEMNKQLLAVVEDSMQPEKIVVWMISNTNKRQEVGG